MTTDPRITHDEARRATADRDIPRIHDYIDQQESLSAKPLDGDAVERVVWRRGFDRPDSTRPVLCIGGGLYPGTKHWIGWYTSVTGWHEANVACEPPFSWMDIPEHERDAALSAMPKDGRALGLASAPLEALTDAACRRATEMGLEITIRVKQKRTRAPKGTP